MSTSSEFKMWHTVRARWDDPQKLERAVRKAMKSGVGRLLPSNRSHNSLKSSAQSVRSGPRQNGFSRGSGGQANSSYGLVPAALRANNPIAPVADDGNNVDLSAEYEFRDEFARRAIQLAPQAVPLDRWWWYFVMQHYRAPTRLLDWTDAALVALYFAVTPPPGANINQSSDAAVWALDAFWLNFTSGPGFFT